MMKQFQANKNSSGKTGQLWVAAAGAKHAEPYCNRNVLEHVKSAKEQRYYAQDAAMLAVTDALLLSMKTAGISQAELAKRIEKSRSHVSQVLSGRRNMTLSTLADILWACRLELRDLVLNPLGQSEVSRERMDVLLDTAFKTVAPESIVDTAGARAENRFVLYVTSLAFAQAEPVGA